jgi:hypothetical protein
MLPAMAPGAKAFFVHGSLGAAGNSGLRPSEPIDTLTNAYAKCTDGAGDVVYIMNDGSSTASVRDVALTWAKDNCHIVGLCAPAINQRSRIAPPTASAVDIDAYTPYLTLSASGCIISNVSWFQGQSENKASVGVKVTGSRNYFNNVSVITGASASTAAQAATYQLQVTGSENVFEKCYIGQDTINRTGANANVRFGSGAADVAARNVFRDCIFPLYASGATTLFITATTADDAARWNLFERCTFLNTSATTMTAGVVWAAGSGLLLLKDCGFYGCTDITAADSTVVLYQGPTPGTPVDAGQFKGIDVA